MDVSDLRKNAKVELDGHPYVVTEFERGRIITMEKNPEWQGEEPGFDEVQYIKYGNQDADRRHHDQGGDGRDFDERHDRAAPERDRQASAPAGSWAVGGNRRCCVHLARLTQLCGIKNTVIAPFGASGPFLAAQAAARLSQGA